MISLEDALQRAAPALLGCLAQLELAVSPAWLEGCLGELSLRIAARAAAADGCQVIGLCGAQGSGKSTLAQLVQLLLEHGFDRRVALLSLDDYYLTRAERHALAARVHPLLRTRGVPGTHAVAALQAALRRLRGLSAGQRLELLRFSKADDDRMPQTRMCVGPVDVVLFEGWCVGARPEPEAALRTPLNELERVQDADATFRSFVNAQLAGAYADLWRELDMLVYLAAPSMEAVRNFRGQQEDALRRRAPTGAKGVMDGPALARFLQHFERITAHMLARAPDYADVVLWLDAQRGCQVHAREPGV